MSFRGFLSILLISYIISMTLHWLYTDISPNNTEYLLLGVLVGSNIMAIKWSIVGYKMLLRAHEVVEHWLVNMSRAYLLQRRQSQRKIFGNFAYKGGVLNKGSTYLLENTSSGVPFVEELSSKVRIFHDKSKYYFENLLEEIRNSYPDSEKRSRWSQYLSSGNKAILLRPEDRWILNKRGCVQPTVAALSTLIDVSQQQNWLREIPTDELLMWLWQIGVSNANDIHIKQQPFVRLALRELCNRARSERAVHASSLNNELKQRASGYATREREFLNNERYHERNASFESHYNDVSPLFEGHESFECLNVNKPIVRGG